MAWRRTLKMSAELSQGTLRLSSVPLCRSLISLIPLSRPHSPSLLLSCPSPSIPLSLRMPRGGQAIAYGHRGGGHLGGWA